MDRYPTLDFIESLIAYLRMTWEEFNRLPEDTQWKYINNFNQLIK